MNIDVHGLLNLSPENMMGQLVAVLGIRGSGKSNTAAVLMEELLAANVPIQVVDIAGEYHTLKDKFDRVEVIGRGIHVQAGTAVTFNNASKIAETTYKHGLPVVLDVSGIPSAAREELLLSYFQPIWDLAATQRIPTVIFLEEAHNWIPQSRKTAVSPLFVDIACEGRKRGLSMVMIGQRSARIDKDVLTQADLAFLHRVRHPSDMQVYQDMIALPRRRVMDMVNRLQTGSALVLEAERVTRYEIRLRHTAHVGATPTLANVPKPTQLSLADLLGR